MDSILTHQDLEKPPTLDYRRVLGEAAWLALPRATRSRFAAHAAVYDGTMRLRSSLLGWLLAWLLGFVGSPLPKVRDALVPTTVVVAYDPVTRGSRWTRTYRIGAREQTVATVKAFDGPRGIVERLPGGLRMPLALFVDGRALHFRSRGYYLEIGALRLPLPSWCPPGRTEVVHRDLGNGRFRFTMRIRHDRLGELFHHDGVFAPRGEPS